MPSATAYPSLEFTDTFLEDYAGRRFSAAERQRIRRALHLLDTNEQHPSLRVHQLHGDAEGSWSVSASDQLRVTFRRLESGRKRLLTCTRHYQR